MGYNLNKTEARKISDELLNKENYENVRVVCCNSGYSVKFDISIDGYIAEGAQIHEKSPKVIGINS